MAVASAMESSVRPLLQSHLEKMSQVASALPAGAESEAEAAAVLSGAPSLRAAVDALSARLDGMAGVGSTGGALSVGVHEVSRIDERGRISAAFQLLAHPDARLPGGERAGDFVDATSAARISSNFPARPSDGT